MSCSVASSDSGRSLPNTQTRAESGRVSKGTSGMTKLRDERMDDARRVRRARWSLCNILAAVVLLPEINAPSMPSFSTVALAAGASVIVLALATRTSRLQALDDALERGAGHLRQRTGVLR